MTLSVLGGVALCSCITYVLRKTRLIRTIFNWLTYASGTSFLSIVGVIVMSKPEEV